MVAWDRTPLGLEPHPSAARLALAAEGRKDAEIS